MAERNILGNDLEHLPTGSQLHREAEQLAVPAFDWVTMPIDAVVEGLTTLPHPRWHVPHWHLPHLGHHSE